MLTEKSPYALFIVVLLVLTFGPFVSSANGQTRTYAQYLSTDGTIGAGGTIVLGTNGVAGSFNVTGTNNISGANPANFATLSATSGTAASGLLGTAGGASTATVYLNLAGSVVYTTGTPVIIKIISGNLANVEAQGYSNTTALGTAQSFTSLTKVQGTTDDYIFLAPSTCNRIRISVKTDAGTTTTAVSNSANLYYVFNVIPPSLNNVVACSNSAAQLDIISPDASLIYKWYTASTGGVLVNTGTSYNPILSSNTTYYVEAVDNNLYSSIRTQVSVTINPLPGLTATPSSTAIPTGASMTLTAASSASTIKWYDHNGAYLATGTTLPLGIQNTMGTFSYTAVADNGTCSSSILVSFSVYSATQCPNLNQRIYANAQTSTGNVLSPADAVDGNPKTGSSLSPVLDLLGLLAPTQSLTWNTTIPAGTAVTVKLGPDPGLLSLISGISVVGLKKSGSIYTEIGSRQSINISLLNLLSGENSFEYTFIPANGLTPENYDGIKIIFSSVLSIGKSLKVFEAYYQAPVSALDCTKKDVIDVLYGAEAPLGIGAITAAVNVTNPWNAVDGNDNTFTTLNAGIGVAAYAKEHIIFSSPSLPGDSLKIVTSANGTLLTLSLLGGFSIQRYLGTSPVGTPIAGSSSLLNISLLNGGAKAVIMLLPMAEPYDQIEIRLGGVVSLLGTMNINEVYRIANTKVTGSDHNNAITVCTGTSVLLPNPSNDCTTYEWYDKNGTRVASPSPKGLELPTASLDSGTYTYYVQPVRFGCNNFMARGTVTVTVNPLPTVSAIIGNTNICVGVGYTFTNTSSDPGVWSSSNTAVATVDATGFVKGITVGKADITYKVTNAATGCSNSTSVTLNVYALPAITLSSIPPICAGSTTASLPYTAVSSGTLKYDIIWNTPFLNNVTGAVLPASPITLDVSASALPGAYTGTFILKNTTTGCSSSYALSVKINPLPTITLTQDASVCQGITTTALKYSGTTQNPLTYSITWDTAAANQGFLPVSNASLPAAQILINAPVSAATGTYSGSITVKNGNCQSTPLNFNFIVHPKPPLPQVHITSN